MADNTTRRAERPELEDNDPFAELTHIMGHDPRQDAAQDAEADLAFDLENELLGTLDLSDDQDPEAVITPAARQEPSWMEEATIEPHLPAYRDASPEAAEPVSGELDFADFDAELHAAFETGLDDQPALAGEMPVAADDLHEADYPPQADYRAADEWSDADALPAEADWRDKEWQETADAAPTMPSAEDRTAADETALDWSPEEMADDWSTDIQAEPESTAEPETMTAPEIMAAPLDEDHFEFDDELMMALAEEPVREDHEVHAAPAEDTYQSPPAASYENFADEIAVDEAPFDDYPVASESVEAPRQLSLEEELTMLLTGADKPRAEPVPAYDVPVASQPMPSRAAEPVVPEPAAVMSRPTWQPRSTPKDEREVPEVETVEMAAFEPIRSAEFDVPDLPVNERVQTASDFDDLAAELSRAFEVGDEQPEANGIDPSYGANRAADDHNRQPDFDWDTVVAASAATGAGQGPEAAHDPYYENEDLYARAGSDAPGAGGFAAYRHDDPFSDELPEERPALRDNRRRNMTIVGGAVAILLLGGVGVFALWSGGGAGGGEPVLLQADSDPVRVRPEEPGGTVVPNQDSEVYQRVAGGREESDPSQTRLIDTAEEPIDLTVQDAPRIVGPDAGVSGFPTDLSAVKAEDRLDAGADTESASATDDVIALQPRRVRTMVVRPDGSIVPRDEPAPAAEVQAESTTAAAPALEQPSSAESTVPATEPVESEAAAETATSMPQEIALAPATRPEPEAAPEPPAAVAAPATPTPAPATAPAAAPAQQVAAVDPAPVVPQAAQSSEWSMQIASQPSSDSAQATYQDLARRYSSLLEGRGVNIVRAEVDGRTFYRVRIPMASRDEAVNLCTSYQSAGGSCFVSR